MQIVKVPQLAWYNPRYLELPLPDNWQVEMFYIAGFDRPELKPSGIRAAVMNPLGTPPLRELAKGKKEVVIVFDDTSRVTRASKIVPYVLEELDRAGISDIHIRFICGLGLHAPISRPDFVKKLGEETVARFRCFNHNPFGNCKYVGTTGTFKTRVCINEEYLKCDLKIIISSCVPHPSAGFGGGSKMVLPGLASYESISWNHKASGAITMIPLEAEAKPVQGMGIVEGNPFKKDVNEAAEMAGVDFMINTINGFWGEPVSVYAGDWKQVQAASVKEAKTHYRVPRITDKDVVICNNYAKASEATVGLVSCLPMVSRNGGDIVTITNAPEGQVTHYLAGPFGRTSFAEQHSDMHLTPNINQVIIFTEYPHPGSSWFEENEKIIYMSKWSEVLNTLRSRHGAGTRVAVIADATNQYVAWDEV